MLGMASLFSADRMEELRTSDPELELESRLAGFVRSYIHASEKGEHSQVGRRSKGFVARSGCSDLSWTNATTGDPERQDTLVGYEIYFADATRGLGGYRTTNTCDGRGGISPLVGCSYSRRAIWQRETLSKVPIECEVSLPYTCDACESGRGSLHVLLPRFRFQKLYNREQ
jgi:hypothetical protein